MSKLSEYLKLIPKGLSNIENVIEGISNSKKFKKNQLSNAQLKEIIRRREICGNCPFNSKNAPTSPEYKKLFGDSYKTDREDLHCSICACVIEYKTASFNDDCGLIHYNHDFPENPQELKWRKFIDVMPPPLYGHFMK